MGLRGIKLSPVVNVQRIFIRLDTHALAELSKKVIGPAEKGASAF